MSNYNYKCTSDDLDDCENFDHDCDICPYLETVQQLDYYPPCEEDTSYDEEE